MTTTATLPRRFLLSLLLVATLAAAAIAGTASAAATPGPVYFQQTTVSPDVSLCTGVTGTTTNTLTIQGHSVAGAAGTFHFYGSFTQNYRSDWSDGTYLISRAVSQVSFDINAVGAATQTEPEQDRGTLYSSTGQILGYQHVWGMFHITFVDGNVTSIASQFRFSCP